MKEKKLTTEEIDEAIEDTKAIWGIEGMGMKEEEEKLHRAYLAGELTKKEYEAHFIKREKD